MAGPPTCGTPDWGPGLSLQRRGGPGPSHAAPYGSSPTGSRPARRRFADSRRLRVGRWLAERAHARDRSRSMSATRGAIQCERARPQSELDPRSCPPLAPGRAHVMCPVGHSCCGRIRQYRSGVPGRWRVSPCPRLGRDGLAGRVRPGVSLLRARARLGRCRSHLCRRRSRGPLPVVRRRDGSPHWAELKNVPTVGEVSVIGSTGAVRRSGTASEVSQ